MKGDFSLSARALAGFTSSFGAGDYDAWLVKTDSMGNMLWNKTQGTSNYDKACALIQTSDGGYALAGYTRSFGAGSEDFWLFKTDSAGNVQWNEIYGGANWDEACALIQTSDGGYALTGFTSSYGAGLGDIWLVKVDASGSVPEFSSLVMLAILISFLALSVVRVRPKSPKCLSGSPL